MKLWLVSQNVATGYDTYDSAVVAAETEKDARETYPGEYTPEGWPAQYLDALFPDWAHPDSVTAKYIGEAAEGVAAGVICASFNAG